MEEGSAENTEVVTGNTVVLFRVGLDDDLKEVEADSDDVGFTTRVEVEGSGVECCRVYILLRPLRTGSRGGTSGGASWILVLL